MQKTVYILVKKTEDTTTYYYHGETEGWFSRRSYNVYSTEEIVLEGIGGYIASKKICTELREEKNGDMDMYGFASYGTSTSHFDNQKARRVCDILNSSNDVNCVYSLGEVEDVNRYKYNYPIRDGKNDIFCKNTFAGARSIQLSEKDKLVINVEKRTQDEIESDKKEIELLNKSLKEINAKIPQLNSGLRRKESLYKAALFQAQLLFLSKISDFIFQCIKNGEIDVHGVLPDFTFKDFQIEKKWQCDIFCPPKRGRGIINVFLGSNNEKIQSFSRLYPMDLALLSQNTSFVKYLISQGELKTSNASLHRNMKYYIDKSSDFMCRAHLIGCPNRFWELSSNPVSLAIHVLCFLCDESMDMYKKVCRVETSEGFFDIFDTIVEYDDGVVFPQDAVFSAILCASIKSNDINRVIDWYHRHPKRTKRAIYSIYFSTFSSYVSRERITEEMKDAIARLTKIEAKGTALDYYFKDGDVLPCNRSPIKRRR